MTSQEHAAQAAQKIIEEMDKLTMLGAALDCMSDAGKAKLQKKMEQIILENQ